MLNALELAALSGILWQGSPPEGHEDVEILELQKGIRAPHGAGVLGFESGYP